MAYINGKKVLFTPKVTIKKIDKEEYAADINAAYDKGRADEKQQHWEDFQLGGKRTIYERAFSNFSSSTEIIWTKEQITPIYDLKPSNAQYMFATTEDLGNLKEWFESLGIALDTSNTDSASQMFKSCKGLTHLPELTFVNKMFTGVISYCTDLVYIEKIKVGKNTTYSSWFNGDTSLSYVRFEGEIGSTISFSYSPLSVESMKSVITHLANLVGTSNEGKYKTTFTSTCWEALEASGKPFDEGLTTDETMAWREYVASIGWTY